MSFVGYFPCLRCEEPQAAKATACATGYTEALRLKPDYPQARRLLNNLMSRAKIKAKG
jgi:hypothetical protein